MLEHYFSQNGLTACYTDTAITLFWDKPAAAGAVETYTILRNDTVADTTTKTHFTLEHLLPETEYTLFVQWRGGGLRPRNIGWMWPLRLTMQWVTVKP